MINKQKAILETIRHWSRPKELVDFAKKRHGFGDDDGGFGVTYPGDLDEYDREVENRDIKEGFVEVYGFLGSPDEYEFVVEESEYLNVLIGFLKDQMLYNEAKRVEDLLLIEPQ